MCPHTFFCVQGPRWWKKASDPWQFPRDMHGVKQGVRARGPDNVCVRDARASGRDVQWTATLRGARW